MSKIKLYNFRKLHAQDLKDPEYRKAWDATEAEDRIIRASIEARIKKKMTQADLARKMGTKQPAISRFESGRSKNHTLAFLRDIAQALGMEVEIRFK